MTQKQLNTKSSIDVLEITKGSLTACILGTSPLIMNRMSQKVLHDLLAPKGKKTAAEKASSMKHHPIEEFRAAPYTLTNEDAPTLLGVLPTAFKKAMCTAALDMPGAKKAQIGRLVSVDWGMQPIYGKPKLFMAVTRSADVNKTPDVRTRAILPAWACTLTVEFVKPILREQAVVNLLAAAGVQCGIGDWRQEKGSGNYGAFKLVSADDPEFLRITSTMGRAAQQAAMDEPECYDAETEELLSWFSVEMNRRGFKVAA